MKIRLLCLTTLIILCFCHIAHADHVLEISLRIGESTLSVNGRSVESPAPYVESGTTLVPLRVISEAFGSDVLWNAEKAEITVAYYNTVLRLFIGSTNAYANEKPVQLPLAPALKDGRAMVPIRFIAEQFGADVFYDEKTASIFVHKTGTASKSAIDYAARLKASKKPRLGDSFMGGWAMDRADALQLTERSFDGMRHVFSLKEDEGSITVHVIPYQGKDTAEAALEDFRAIGSYATVRHLDINKTPTGIPYAHIQYKTTSAYYSTYADERVYFSNGYKATLCLSVNHEIDEQRLLALYALLDTFDFNFDARCEELSDVNPDTLLRTYRHPELGISLSIPAFFSEHVGAMNSISFTDSESSGYVQLSMYSSVSGGTCLDWVQSDLKNNKALFSEKHASFSALTQTEINGHKAYMYTYEVKHDGILQKYTDIFVERDAYFYNIGICHTDALQKRMRATALAATILESIKFHSIDSEKLGTMLRTDSMDGIVYQEHAGLQNTIAFQKPRIWRELISEDNRIVIADAAGHAGVEITRYARTTFASLPKAAAFMKQQFADTAEDFRLLREQQTVFSGKTAYSLETTAKDKHRFSYVLQHKNNFYCVSFFVHPLYDGTRHETVRKTFFDSFAFLTK